MTNKFAHLFISSVMFVSCGSSGTKGTNSLLSTTSNNATTTGGSYSSLAMGIRSMNGEETGVGIKYDTVVPSSNAKGGITVSHAELVSSYEELAQKSDVSIDMNFQLYGFKMSGSSDFFKSFHYNSKSQYLYAEIAISTPSREIRGYRFSTEAQGIAEQDIAKFYRVYGDQFVYKELRGASLKIIFEFNSSSSDEEESNSVSISLTQKFFMGGCSINTKYSSQYKQIEENSHIKVYLNKQGNYSELPDFTFQAFADEYRKFPTTVDPGQGGYDVVTGVETLGYQYAENKPSTIDNLGAIVDADNKYAAALNRRICKLYESLGNLNYVKLNKLDYPAKTADSLIAYQSEVEKEIQQTVDMYNTFKATYKISTSVDDIDKMALTYVQIPEVAADDFLPPYTFGANAVDNKIYLGKIVTSHNTPLKIYGKLNFLDKAQAANVLSFDPIFHDAFLTELQSRMPFGFRGDFSTFVTPRIAPIHIYLNDMTTNVQIKEYVYQDENSIILPPGKYLLYVYFDPYGRLVNPNAPPSLSHAGGDEVVVKKSVVTIASEDFLTINFRN